MEAANAHGRQMHEAGTLLRRAAEDEPDGLLPVVEKATTSSVRIVLRADDSSGMIGDAIHDLLALHADLARSPAGQPGPRSTTGHYPDQWPGPGN